MRIGLVTSSYPISSTDTVNAGVFVRDLAHELVALGYPVHVLTPRKCGKPEPSELVELQYIPWWGGERDLASASLHNPLTLVRYATLVASGLWSVGRYVQRRKLSVLLAMWAIPSGLFCWLAWKRHGIPYGVWALGSDIWARHKYPWGDRIVRMVLRDARFRFADGIRLADEVAQLSGASCEFVPSVRRLEITNKLNPALLPEGEHFLFVGRYEHNKGPDILIEAMRLLLESGSKAYLHMFGGGSLETRLRKRIEGYEQYIHIGGYADPNQVIAYMSACDWLVIPSRIESIPLIFVDALQMRLPMIAADVGDLGDLIRRFGVGNVVPPCDPAALATAMQAALSCSRADFDSNWEKAQGIFSLKHSAVCCAEFLSAAQREIGK